METEALARGWPRVKLRSAKWELTVRHSRAFTDWEAETSMIRLIFGNYDAAAMATGAADTTDATLKSFDIEAPEIEKWVNEDVGYTKRVFIGIEYLR